MHFFKKKRSRGQNKTKGQQWTIVETKKKINLYNIYGCKICISSKRLGQCEMCM